TVFSCVASRNKRCVSHSQLAASALISSLYPKFSEAALAMRKHRSVPPGSPGRRPRRAVSSGSKLDSRPLRLKRNFTRFAVSKIEMKFLRATQKVLKTARHALRGKSFKHAVVFEQDFPRRAGKNKTEPCNSKSRTGR
ncbi:hypothetical protein, partial [uncultured Rikenella sp.]|uniref:hypothetical protein n=1 Tax=uncultured Rikenella sp. TaxID=368003 RepID=UPI00261C370E